MLTEVVEVEVVVLGAGTAGANVAHQLARRGRTVALVERRAFAAAGARWLNGMVDRHFDQAGLARPAGAERVGEGGALHLRTPDDEPALVVRDNPVVGVDMALLGDRLRALAVADGAQAFEHASGLVLREAAGRAVSLHATAGRPGEQPRPMRFDAALFVDASGRAGGLRRRSSVLSPWCPTVHGPELCSASDVVFSVADRDGARRWLDRRAARPGEAVNVLGRDGGFSTRSVVVAPELDEVRVLVGCIADGRSSTATRMLDEVRRDHPWIGAPRHGGTGVIPLRRPYARFVAPGLALVGDAASQVFPAHGSGIGIGLIAGTTLAAAVAGAPDPGDEATVWRYQTDFLRAHGRDLAFYDTFRRFNTAIGTAGVGALLRAGAVTEDLARAGLDQRRAAPSPRSVPGAAAGLARVPRLAAALARSTARGVLAAELMARPPAESDPAALSRWDRRLTALVERR